MQVNKKHSLYLTKDKELLKDSNYTRIMEIVDKLVNGGILERGKGYCYSVSDMVRTLLLHEGIRCKIVEVQLAVVSENPPGMQMLGYDHATKNRDVPTHVVVVTETPIPVLIDLTVGYMRPDLVPYVVERANAINGNIAEYTFQDSSWIYTMKEVQYFPGFHQQNIVDHIATERRVRNEMKVLKIGIAIVFIVTILNAGRGLHDYYQTYVLEDNGWGPAQIVRSVELKNKIKHLEQQVNILETETTAQDKK